MADWVYSYHSSYNSAHWQPSSYYPPYPPYPPYHSAQPSIYYSSYHSVQPSSDDEEQYSDSDIDEDNTCIMCEAGTCRPRRRFCSKQCTIEARRQAPNLIKVPVGHPIHNKAFIALWESWDGRDSKLPEGGISAIYSINCTKEMRTIRKQYRENVGGEFTLLFRSEKRACRLGDSQNPKRMVPCDLKNCALCQAIKTGFQSSLDHKREVARKHSGDTGVRFGAGIYMTPTASKAAEYAKNINGQSDQRAMLVVRAVLGKQQILEKEDHDRYAPDPGYDSVRGIRRAAEDVVFTADAVLPAFLILFRR